MVTCVSLRLVSLHEPLPASRADYSTDFWFVTIACAERSGTATNVGPRRREPASAISPEWHARGSAGPLSACKHSNLENIGRIISPTLPTSRVGVLHMASNKSVREKDWRSRQREMQAA